MIRAFIKPANIAAAGYSFLKSSATGRLLMHRMPLTLSTELTNCCNLNCPECSSGSGKMTREKGYMNHDLFRKIIDELAPYLLNLNLYFQGEPMLHPDFFSFLSDARKIRSVVSTNGHFLSRENARRLSSSGLNELIVSLDGIDQETYSAYRVNGDVTKVLEGISNISDAIRKSSSGLKLTIQFLVNRQNERQLPEIRRFAGKMKASLKLKSMQIINEKNYEVWLPSEERFRRYERKSNGYALKNKLPDYCSRLWFSPVITWDGKVLPCCFDKDAAHVMGDLNEDSFMDIWNGPKYRLFRKTMLGGRRTIDICRTCSSGISGVVC